ncbi:hypothetical protein [Acidithiobacillus concretivorus]|uniref:hypothetical protein n=1 Tax=Acidithiobacillus concretivorus TaxID=3063952 RepID=UPI001D006CF8|nr:hypothetical protein [Acidithiobacillus concretivorus]
MLLYMSMQCNDFLFVTDSTTSVNQSETKITERVLININVQRGGLAMKKEEKVAYRRQQVDEF